MNLPGYSMQANVPNPYVKQNVILNAWTRQTMYWDVTCEWNGESR